MRRLVSKRPLHPHLMFHTPAVASFKMYPKDLEAGAGDDVSAGYVPLLQEQRSEEDNKAQSETYTYGRIGGGTCLNHAVSVGF